VCQESVSEALWEDEAPAEWEKTWLPVGPIPHTHTVRDRSAGASPSLSGQLLNASAQRTLRNRPHSGPYLFRTPMTWSVIVLTSASTSGPAAWPFDDGWLAALGAWACDGIWQATPAPLG
jgi:hypothetical protein